MRRGWFRRRRSATHADFDWTGFKRRVAKSAVTSTKSLGSGSDLRLKGPALAGCALESESLLHVMLFPA